MEKDKNLSRTTGADANQTTTLKPICLTSLITADHYTSFCRSNRQNKSALRRAFLIITGNGAIASQLRDINHMIGK